LRLRSIVPIVDRPSVELVEILRLAFEGIQVRIEAADRQEDRVGDDLLDVTERHVQALAEPEHASLDFDDLVVRVSLRTGADGRGRLIGNVVAINESDRAEPATTALTH